MECRSAPGVERGGISSQLEDREGVRQGLVLGIPQLGLPQKTVRLAPQPNALPLGSRPGRPEHRLG